MQRNRKKKKKKPGGKSEASGTAGGGQGRESVASAQCTTPTKPEQYAEVSSLPMKLNIPVKENIEKEEVKDEQLAVLHDCLTSDAVVAQRLVAPCEGNMLAQALADAEAARNASRRRHESSLVVGSMLMHDGPMPCSVAAHGPPLVSHEIMEMTQAFADAKAVREAARRRFESLLV